MYYLNGDNGNIATFEKFDKEKIKNAIVSHLTANPDDLIEYCKDWDDPKDNKKYYPKCIDMYEVHNGRICKIIFKGSKEYHKALTE